MLEKLSILTNIVEGCFMFFCQKCGKEVENKDDLIDGLCRECYLNKQNVKVKFPKNIRISICYNCGCERIIDPVVETDLKKLKKQVEILDDNKAKLTIEGEYKRRKYCFEKILPIVYRQSLCDLCSSIHQQKYSYKFQLRGEKNEKYKEIKKFLENRCDWFEEIKEGFDFYFVDKKQAKKIVNHLKRNKFDILITHKYSGFIKDKSKKIYKTIVRIRI